MSTAATCPLVGWLIDAGTVIYTLSYERRGRGGGGRVQPLALLQMHCIFLAGDIGPG